MSRAPLVRTTSETQIHDRLIGNVEMLSRHGHPTVEPGVIPRTLRAPRMP